MWGVLLGIVSLLLFVYYSLKPKRPPNFPPGPAAYPIVGSIPALLKLDKSVQGAMQKVSEIYGPVSSFYMGKNASIYVIGWDAVKQVLSRDEFSGRPQFFFAEHPKLHKTLGMMFLPYNEFWKTQRRFALRRLRDWGFGKTTLEGLIHEEIEETFEQMDKKAAGNNGVVSIADAFGIPIINILWAVVAGKRFSHEDETLKELLRRIYASFRNQNFANSLISDYPFLRYFPYFSGNYREFITAKETTEKTVEDAVDEHIASRDPLHPRDFLDEYLNEMEKEKGRPDTTFFREQLVALTMDMFNAGAESTSNTIAYGLLYMILYPDVQEKIAAEIKEVIGSNRLPLQEDRASMPYTEAVLHELMRIAPIAPQAVPHCTTEDTTLNGFSIPKDTLIFVSLSSVNMDPKIYGDPENFRPERFLDSQGKFVKNEEFVPFGLGKRICVGESLARMTYFLLFTAMIQRYRFQVVPGQEKPSVEPVLGFTIAPQPFSAKLTTRN